MTGGGTGIGAAIARALAKEGSKLTLVGRRRTKLEESADLLSVDTGIARENIVIAPADVTARIEVDAAFAEARDRNGPIDILVNNAGAASSRPFAKLDAETWSSTIAVNLDALLHCCQAALPDLLESSSGRIVTIASTAGLKGYVYTAAYVAAKHGAVGLTRAIATEYARTNLTANAVCPGFTDTDIVSNAITKITQKSGRTEADARAEIERFNPQHRLISPAEVGNAVVWLCLPESRSITGQAIAVAGGEVM